MKIKLFVLAVWIGIISWYSYEYYSIQKEKAEWHARQLRAVDQE